VESENFSQKKKFLSEINSKHSKKKNNKDEFGNI
jgi:hypothetical protein